MWGYRYLSSGVNGVYRDPYDQRLRLVKIIKGLSLFPENKFQRHTIKAECFTDLIGQVPFVGKMDDLGVADKEDESGRFDIGLGRIRNCLLYTSDAADEEDSVDL